MQAYNTDVLQARADNPDLAFTIPVAGGTRWTDLLCIPTDAPNPEAANRFIAFYLDPAVSARNAEANQVDTGNQAAADEVDDALAADPAVFPPSDVEQRLVVLQDLGSAEDRYRDAWKSIKG